MSLWWCNDCKISFAHPPLCPRCGKGGTRREPVTELPEPTEEELLEIADTLLRCEVRGAPYPPEALRMIYQMLRVVPWEELKRILTSDNPTIEISQYIP
jgi:hypothetical protein